MAEAVGIPKPHSGLEAIIEQERAQGAGAFPGDCFRFFQIDQQNFAAVHDIKDVEVVSRVHHSRYALQRL